MRNWKDFETAFWEKEISVGRVFLSRSSVFLNHWLVSITGTEVVAREVFSRFKSFVQDRGEPMARTLDQVRRAADLYRTFVESAESTSGPAGETNGQTRTFVAGRSR